LSFERNLGQTASRVDFLAHAGNATVFLTPTAAVFAMQGRSELSDQRSAGLPSTAPERRGTNVGVALYMDLVGANPASRAAGVNPLPGKVNYLTGRDPAKWHTDVPTYGRVEYPNVYRGVSLAYYGGPGGLEYDFTVSPGADPSTIALKFGGAGGLELDARGDLLVHTAAGELVQHAPVAYQDAGGTRQPVASRFALHPELKTQDSTLITFDLGPYDHSRRLVIDPLVLGYSTYLGGKGNDYGEAIAVDAAGSAYVAGSTTSSNFPTTPGAFDPSYNGGFLYGDAFVSKLSPAGGGLVYSTYLGGSDLDQAFGIALDGAGEAYVTGRTESADFPVTPGAFQTAYGGYQDAFVAELNATGSGLVYGTYLGGSHYDEAYAIARDTAGNVYVVGDTSGNFPTTRGAFNTTLNGDGGEDIFVTKLNAGGSALGYSTYLGGNNFDYGEAIAVDGAGSAYVTGDTRSTDFPTTPGAFQTGHAKADDAFVTKLTPGGNALAYSTYLGGNGGDDGHGIAVDGAGYAYVTGGGNSSDFPFTVYFSTYKSGGFITKVNPVGTGLVYSACLGDAESLAIALDGAGNSYVTGYTRSATQFPTTSDAFDKTYNGGQVGYDAFLSKLNAGGNRLVYSTYLGGSGDDFYSTAIKGSGAIAVDAAGNAYLTGATDSRDFPTTQGAFDTTSNRGYDAFVTRFANVQEWR
jgi:hypothetical protein